MQKRGEEELRSPLCSLTLPEGPTCPSCEANIYKVMGWEMPVYSCIYIYLYIYIIYTYNYMCV